MAVSKGFELASLGSALDTSQTDGEVLAINMDTDVVAEGTTNLYFTNERVDDRVNGLLVAGSSVSLTYDDVANTLTIALDTTGGLDLSNNSTADLPEDPAATTTSGTMYYTDTRVQTYLSGGSVTTIETTGDVIIGGNLTVNGSSSTINSTQLTVDDLNITIASGAPDAASANGAGITVDGANATIIYNGLADTWVFNKAPYYNTNRLLTTADWNDSNNHAFKNISDGTNTAVADSNTDTFNITSTDQIEVSIASLTDTLTIGHANSGVVANSYGSSTAIPVITVDAQGHITAATTANIVTEWFITDGTVTQTIAAGNTLTVVDGTDINAVVSATDQLTINNTSTLDSVTGRGATTTNAITVGNTTINGTLSATGTTLLGDQTRIKDTAFTTAYNNITGLVLDSSDLAGTSAGYGVPINFTAQASTNKKAAIAPYQNSADPDDVSLRFFVSNSLTATDPVVLALELLRGGQLKVSNAYTLPTADGAANQTLVTNGSGVLSFSDISSSINWNVADNYAYKTVTVEQPDGSDIGSVEADSNIDTLFIREAQVDSTDGIVLGVNNTGGADIITIAHADTSSVGNLTAVANTFVSALTFDTYGHVQTRTTATVDFDVSTNYAYKFMSDGTNTAGAASNVDTFTFTNGTDTTAVVNAANDSVTFNNTSTLDSVTGRGNTTTNNITVGDMTVNGNLTVNGSTTTLDTTNLLVEDPVIVLAKNQATPANDIGFLFQRYSAPTASNYNVAIVWNETDDRLVFGETTETGADNAISTSNEWMTVTNTGRVGIGTTNPAYMLDVFEDAAFENGKLIINEVTGVDAYTEIRKTNTGSNLAITSPESVYILLDSNNDQTTRAFFVKKDTTAPGAGTTLFYVQENGNVVAPIGNVGFGTNNPQTKLHLYANNDGGAANNTLRFEDADAGVAVGQQLGLIEFYGNDTSTGSSGQKAYIGAFAESLTPQAYLAFATDGLTGTATERVRITSAGSVGIGTTNPAQLLHIVGSSTASIRGLIENSSIGQASWDLKNSEGEFRIITDAGELRIYDQTDTTDRFKINTLGAITFNNAYTFPTADGSANQALITDGAGNITFGSLSSTIDWNVAANYAFQTIATPAGTSPVADSSTDTLTLANGADITITGNSATDTVTIANTSTLQSVTGRGATTTNNVGIGTTDVASTLVVANNLDTNTDWYSNSQSTIRLKNNNANGAAVLKFDDGLSRIVYGVASAGDKLIFSSRESAATTTEVITFNNDGEVGIGTVDPIAKLHIGPFQGSTTSPHLLLTSGNNAYGWRLDTADLTGGSVPLRLFKRTSGVDTEVLTVLNENGRVGIGSTTPEEQLTLGSGNLQVNDGWGWFKGDSSANNIALRLGQYTSDPNTSLVDIFTDDDTGDVLNTVLKRYTHNFRWSRGSPIGTFNSVQFLSQGDAGQSYTRFNLFHQDDPVNSTVGTQDVSITTGTEVSYIRRGNVGIGTTNPLAKLHVEDAVSDLVVRIRNTQASGANNTLAFYHKDASDQDVLGYIRTSWWNDPGMTFKTPRNLTNRGFTWRDANDSEVMRLTWDGQLGIGTTDPSEKFHIANAMSSSPYYIYMEQTGTNAVGGGAGIIFDTSASNTDKAFFNAKIEGVRNSQDDGSSDLKFYTSDVSIASGASTQKMVITSLGNVGIGITNPADPLSIVQTNQFGIRLARAGHDTMGIALIGSQRLAIINYTDGNREDLVIEKVNGNVGIGTDTPGSKLDVNGTITSNGLRVDVSDGGSVLVYGGAGTVSEASYYHAQGRARFGYDGTDVSIADINETGTVTNKDLSVNLGGAERLRVKHTTGNVGIGTTTPQEKLQVEGNVQVNGAVRIDSAYNLDSASATLATTTQTAIASVSATTFGSAKFLIQVLDTVTGERQVSELLVLHDGTNTYDTEYAILKTGANLIATFATDISGGNLRLLATSASTNSTQYKVKQTLMLA